MKEIQAGDGLLLGDHCRVRPSARGVVEELPTNERRTYRIRLESGELVEREWLQIDRISNAEGRSCGGNRSEASIGAPIEWDARPSSSGGAQIARRPTCR